jgi:hypothetical protein
MLTEQSQRGGANSTNIQVFQTGPGMQETRTLVLDIVRAEMYRYQQSADATVQGRLEKIADDVIQMIGKKDAQAAAAFADPDIQYSTATVGREYARVGDDDLGQVLVGLLGDRIDAESRTLLAVVLNDAIQIAARLTDRELDALSLSWRVIRTQSAEISNLESLRAYMIKHISPFTLPEGEASYYHLESLGCAAVQNLSETKFGDAFVRTYPGIFSKGFTLEEIPDELKQFASRVDVFTPCLRDPDKLQVNAVSDSVIERIAETAGIPEQAVSLKTLEAAHRMSIEEVEVELAAIDPAIAVTISRWNSTPAQSLRVSAVGIAIAHANYRRATGMSTPLSVWIS